MNILFFILFDLIQADSVRFTSNALPNNLMNKLCKANDNLTAYFEMKMINAGQGKFVLTKLDDKVFQAAYADFVESNIKSVEFVDETDDTKMIKRSKIFKNNVYKIMNHNVKFYNNKTTYKMGINRDADVDDEEFVANKCNQGPDAIMRTNETIIAKYLKFEKYILNDPFLYLFIPSKLDLRKEKIITLRPRKQEIRECCSSYALATVSAMEAHFLKKTKKYVALSPQHLIENTCHTNYGNQGCNGGSVLQTLGFIKDVGIASADDYMYMGVEFLQKMDGVRIATKINNIIRVNGEKEMILALKNGPVISYINIEGLRFYRSGYGIGRTSYGVELYWLVQNFWDKSWGDEGFFQILRGANHCGIGVEGYFPSF